MVRRVVSAWVVVVLVAAAGWRLAGWPKKLMRRAVEKADGWRRGGRDSPAGGERRLDRVRASHRRLSRGAAAGLLLLVMLLRCWADAQRAAAGASDWQQTTLLIRRRRRAGDHRNGAGGRQTRARRRFQ